MSDDRLANYETVKERKKKFYEKFPDGRIIAELIKGDAQCAQFKATVFKTIEDQKSNLPLATGYAQEFKGQGGFANKHSWLENCEESAIGRALDNAGFSTNNKCSQEEMKKVYVAEESEASAPKQPTQRRPVAQPSAGDPGEYRVSIGKKFKGQRLKEIPKSEILSYVEWLENQALQKGQELSQEAVFLKKAVDRWLAYDSQKESYEPENAFLADEPWPEDERKAGGQ